MIEAFAFREDAESPDAAEGTSVSVPAGASTASQGLGDGEQQSDGTGGGLSGVPAGSNPTAGAAGTGEDDVLKNRRRRLDALENCLDAFERYSAICCLHLLL